MQFYSVNLAQVWYVVKSEAYRWPGNCILENLPQIFRFACYTHGHRTLMQIAITRKKVITNKK